MMDDLHPPTAEDRAAAIMVEAAAVADRLGPEDWAEIALLSAGQWREPTDEEAAQRLYGLELVASVHGKYCLTPLGAAVQDWGAA